MQGWQQMLTAQSSVRQAALPPLSPKSEADHGQREFEQQRMRSGSPANSASQKAMVVGPLQPPLPPERYLPQPFAEKAQLMNSRLPCRGDRPSAPGTPVSQLRALSSCSYMPSASQLKALS